MEPPPVLSDMVLVSTLAFLGMGSVLLGERGGLVLVERFPLSRRFTSSNSVPAKSDHCRVYIPQIISFLSLLCQDQTKVNMSRAEM